MEGTTSKYIPYMGTVTIDKKYITASMMHSIERWKQIKEEKYKKICPFSLMRGPCVCDDMIKAVLMAKGSCLFMKQSVSTMNEIIEWIIKIWNEKDGSVKKVDEDDDIDEIYNPYCGL